MKPLVTLIIKFLTCLIAFGVGLDLFFDANLAEILSFSVFLTVVSYFLGDKVLLPRFGNTNSLFVDFLLAYLTVWIFGSVLLQSYVQIGWGSIISAVIVTAGEIVVHRFLLNQATNQQENNRQQASFVQKPAYGMEMGEERDPRDDI